jgi:hypothetical protein
MTFLINLLTATIARSAPRELNVPDPFSPLFSVAFSSTARGAYYKMLRSERDYRSRTPEADMKADEN